jgi:hypothetical protein
MAKRQALQLDLSQDGTQKLIRDIYLRTRVFSNNSRMLAKATSRKVSSCRSCLFGIPVLMSATGLNASMLMRTHFSSRTTSLLVPLHRYLNSLIPSPAEYATARAQNRLLHIQSFNSADFFASLNAHGAPLPFKSTAKRKAFYERWLKTPAFGLWLANQEDVVESVHGSPRVS